MVKANLLGREIKRNLYLLGKNQKWLAEEVGVTEGAISNIVCGRSKPSQKTLLKIADKLLINVEELVSCLLEAV